MAAQFSIRRVFIATTIACLVLGALRSAYDLGYRRGYQSSVGDYKSWFEEAYQAGRRDAARRAYK